MAVPAAAATAAEADLLPCENLDWIQLCSRPAGPLQCDQDALFFFPEREPDAVRLRERCNALFFPARLTRPQGSTLEKGSLLMSRIAQLRVGDTVPLMVSVLHGNQQKSEKEILKARFFAARLRRAASWEYELETVQTRHENSRLPASLADIPMVIRSKDEFFAVVLPRAAKGYWRLDESPPTALHTAAPGGQAPSPSSPSVHAPPQQAARGNAPQRARPQPAPQQVRSLPVQPHPVRSGGGEPRDCTRHLHFCTFAWYTGQCALHSPSHPIVPSRM